MKVHEIDPTGDVLLTLRTVSAMDSEGSPSETHIKSPAGSAGISVPASPSVEQDNLSESNPTPKSASVALSSLPHHNSTQNVEDRVVQFRLSSKHLTLASDYFRCMLTGPWKEASRDDDAIYTVTAEDWDDEALLIVLNIVHGQNRHVPRNIKLELLTEVAIIVDYYKLRQIIEPWYTSIWPRHICFDVSQGYNKDFASRLFISWAFSDAEAFSTLTRDIVRQSREPLRAWDLPIPMEIISAVAEQRERVLGEIFSHLYQVLDELRDNEPSCSFECSSILLGALTRQMNEKRILHPRPTAPFLGHSALELAVTVRRLREPNWGKQSRKVNESREPIGQTSQSRCTCRLSSLTMPRINELTRSNLGLRLLDFPRSDNEDPA